MEKEKSKFGLTEINNPQWHYFKDNDQPVYTSFNGQSHCGMVKEINRELITLQPCVLINSYGTEYTIENTVSFVSSQAHPSSIKENNLEDYVKGLNHRRLQERIAKGECIIIVPKPNF